MSPQRKSNIFLPAIGQTTVHFDTDFILLRCILDYYDMIDLDIYLDAYEVSPKRKCTDFPCIIWESRSSLMYIGELVMTLAECILVETGSVESVVSCCCLCTVVVYNLCNVCDAAVLLFTKNFYLQDRQLITSSTKMTWNNFGHGSTESGRTSQAIGFCTTITHQLTQRFQLGNYWQRKTFPPSLQPRFSSVWFLPLP
jgi:hypothetical protein